MAQTVALSLDEEEAQGYRSQFPIFDYTTYLNSCSLGPPSRGVQQALTQYHEDWSRYGAPAWWKLWMPKLDEAKQRFATLIGASPHEVTISHSISSALSSVASTLNYASRPSVACADIDFPTIPYQWLAKSRLGVDVRYVRSPDRVSVPFSAYEEVVDGQTAAIAASHVFYATGHVQPVRQLADLAHRHGARVIIDGYHAVGVLPVNVKELDVDFYVGGTLKWLLGGPGLTFIYVREELIPEVSPTVTGWFSSANQFAFDPLNLDWPMTADRLELGTPSVATAYAGVVGMDMILEVGPARIYERLRYLTSKVVDRARQEGYGVMSPSDATERGGIVMLRVKEPEETVNALADKGFTIDYRPGLIRVSPHFYNTERDVDTFMDALAEVQSAY